MYIELYIKRKEKRMFKKDVAKKLGISRESYSSKEKGVRDFTLREAKALSKMFDCSLDELFKEDASA